MEDFITVFAVATGMDSLIETLKWAIPTVVSVVMFWVNVRKDKFSKSKSEAETENERIDAKIKVDEYNALKWDKLSDTVNKQAILINHLIEENDEIKRKLKEAQTLNEELRAELNVRKLQDK